MTNIDKRTVLVNACVLLRPSFNFYRRDIAELSDRDLELPELVYDWRPYDSDRRDRKDSTCTDNYSFAISLPEVASTKMLWTKVGQEIIALLEKYNSSKVYHNEMYLAGILHVTYEY